MGSYFVTCREDTGSLCLVLRLRTGHSVTKKRFCTRPVPFVAQEHSNDLPLLIHRAI